MSKGLQDFLSQLAVRIAVAIVIAMTTGQAPQAAEPPGYWSCNGTEWVAVGAPEHPKPIVRCGGDGSGQGATTEELCVAAGGIWGPVGLFPEPVCTQRTIDEGRICADMGECGSSCDAVLTDEQYQSMMDGEQVLTTGFCSGSSPLIGCHTIIVAGVVQGTLCID